jgi:hypothetical protein
MSWKKRGEVVLVDGGEYTGGLDDVVGTDRAPRDVSRIPLSVHGDGFALNPELAILGLDGSIEPSMDGIILEHVDLLQIKLFISPNYDPDGVRYHVVKIDEGTGFKGQFHCRRGQMGCALVNGDDIELSEDESVPEDDAADTT